MDQPRISSIAIVGAGAIGMYYGVRLALAGGDVRFLLRGDLAVARERGLRVVERDQTLALNPAKVHGSTEEIGPVDLVLITLKTTGNDALRTMLPPLLHEKTIVATLQNGLGNEELVASIAGNERTMGGLCFIASTRTAPGEVSCYHPGSVTLGEFGRPASDRTYAIAEMFRQAGIKCQAVDNLSEARWRKLVWNIPFNGLSIVAGGITTDRILADPTLASEVRALMDEIANTARHFGYDVPERFIQGQIDVTRPMGAYQPSSLVDFKAGREVEVEPIWGEPLRRGRAAGLTMPRLSLLYALLRQVTTAGG